MVCQQMGWDEHLMSEIALQRLFLASSDLLCCWRATELQHNTELGLLVLNEEGVSSICEASASQQSQHWNDNCLAI